MRRLRSSIYGWGSRRLKVSKHYIAKLKNTVPPSTVGAALLEQKHCSDSERTGSDGGGGKQ